MITWIFLTTYSVAQVGRKDLNLTPTTGAFQEDTVELYRMDDK